LRGRRVRVPGRAVRPTQDRVREALFSILGERIVGSRFLDLYAGAGTVGLEAWSRGAAFVCWVESDRRVLRVLEANVEACCEDRVLVHAGNVVRFLKKGLAIEPFEIIFADPPYGRGRGSDRPVERVMAALPGSGCLAEGGMVILEERSGTESGPGSGWVCVDEREYGQTRLLFCVAATGAGGRSPEKGR